MFNRILNHLSGKMKRSYCLSIAMVTDEGWAAIELRSPSGDVLFTEQTYLLPRDKMAMGMSLNYNLVFQSRGVRVKSVAPAQFGARMMEFFDANLGRSRAITPYGNIQFTAHVPQVASDTTVTLLVLPHNPAGKRVEPSTYDCTAVTFISPDNFNLLKESAQRNVIRLKLSCLVNHRHNAATNSHRAQNRTRPNGLIEDIEDGVVEGVTEDAVNLAMEYPVMYAELYAENMMGLDPDQQILSDADPSYDDSQQPDQQQGSADLSLSQMAEPQDIPTPGVNQDVDVSQTPQQQQDNAFDAFIRENMQQEPERANEFITRDAQAQDLPSIAQATDIPYADPQDSSGSDLAPVDMGNTGTSGDDGSYADVDTASSAYE